MSDTIQAQLPEFRPIGQALRENAEIAVGKYGSTVITGAGVYTPTGTGRFWSVIIPITALTFIKADFGSNPPEGNIAGIAFPAGYPIYGEFKGMTIASGTAMAYYGKPGVTA